MIEYTNKITALYSRLSVGDEDRDGGESNSIVNQKGFLERYARQHKLMDIRHYIDDDESGRFFDRSAYTQMISDVESGKNRHCHYGRDDTLGTRLSSSRKCNGDIPQKLKKNKQDNFYNEHTAEIILFESAKKYFKEHLGESKS
jgi:hypothetical protein